MSDDWTLTPEEVERAARDAIERLDDEIKALREDIQGKRATIAGKEAEKATWKRLLPRAKPVRKPKAKAE